MDTAIVHDKEVVVAYTLRILNQPARLFIRGTDATCRMDGFYTNNGVDGVSAHIDVSYPPSPCPRS
jgi:hypothetical protein